MTIKQAVDYDGQVAPWRFGYAKAAATGDWVLAAHFIELLNACLTPANRIDDLPRFSIKPNSFTEKATIRSDAMRYCYDHMPVVEQAVGDERAMLYNFYKAGM